MRSDSAIMDQQKDNKKKFVRSAGLFGDIVLRRMVLESPAAGAKRRGQFATIGYVRCGAPASSTTQRYALTKSRHVLFCVIFELQVVCMLAVCIGLVYYNVTKTVVQIVEVLPEAGESYVQESVATQLHTDYDAVSTQISDIPCALLPYADKAAFC